MFCPNLMPRPKYIILTKLTNQPVFLLVLTKSRQKYKNVKNIFKVKKWFHFWGVHPLIENITKNKEGVYPPATGVVSSILDIMNIYITPLYI